MIPLHIIVIDDDPSICLFLHAALTAGGHHCETFLRADDAESYLGGHEVDLAMIDVFLGDANGIDLVQRFRAIQPDMHVVVMTAHVSLESAARSVADGAIDYISKPIDLSQLRELCRRTAEIRTRAQQPAPEQQASSAAIIGRSPCMLEVFKDIGRVASSDVNALITGASGTGKELVARTIHSHSRRREQSFVAVNCGSFTETILESELFGHEKGAFTGADRVHKGLIEAAGGGTLFLDEVTETALSFQVKLLRVLQEQQVRRLGSNIQLPVDVRVLAATNRDVTDLLRRGLFREDLYYRLAVVEIALPALEERREDIPLLVEHFLQKFNARNQRKVAIEGDAVRRLQARSWPGNVRELENTVYRLAIFARGDCIAPEDVEPEPVATSEAALPVPAQPDRLLELERQHIIRMLQVTHFNKSETARRLGIERKTLYKKAVRLGINLQPTEKL